MTQIPAHHRAAVRSRIAARRWLRHLTAHVPAAVAGKDPEGVHQVRVAAGRLSVWLEMGGRRVLRDDLRAVRRVAAAVRDCDVLLARRPPSAFAALLHDMREQGRAAMIPRLTGPGFRALRLALGLLPSVSGPDGVRSLRRFRDRALRRGDALVSAQRPDDEVFHALRRSLRKLRYALEWLGLDAAPVRKLQHAFGDLNDLAVELRVLTETGASRAFPRRAAMLRRRLDRAKSRTLAAWERSRASVEAICEQVERVTDEERLR